MFGMVKDSFYNITQLKKDFGLRTDAVWYDGLDQAPIRRVEYIRKMRSNGEELNKKTPYFIINDSRSQGRRSPECCSLNRLKS